MTIWDKFKVFDFLLKKTEDKVEIHRELCVYSDWWLFEIDPGKPKFDLSCSETNKPTVWQFKSSVMLLFGNQTFTLLIIKQSNYAYSKQGIDFMQPLDGLL